MDKNYYEVLEVSKNASSEVIEKAYKALVKKYHPDLQPDELKNKYENEIKLINEAYEVLSDEVKKQKYDEYLASIETSNSASNQISSDAINELYNENLNLKNEINNLKYNQNVSNNNFSNYDNEYYKNTADYIAKSLNRKLNNVVNQAYNDAYYEDLKRRGYKIRYKKSFKDYLKSFFALVLTVLFLVLVGFVLWQIPAVRDYFVNLYNNNEVIKGLIDTFFRH